MDEFKDKKDISTPPAESGSGESVENVLAALRGVRPGDASAPAARRAVNKPVPQSNPTPAKSAAAPSPTASSAAQAQPARRPASAAAAHPAAGVQQPRPSSNAARPRQTQLPRTPSADTARIANQPSADKTQVYPAVHSAANNHGAPTHAAAPSQSAPAAHGQTRPASGAAGIPNVPVTSHTGTMPTTTVHDNIIGSSRRNASASNIAAQNLPTYDPRRAAARAQTPTPPTARQPQRPAPQQSSQMPPQRVQRPTANASGAAATSAAANQPRPAAAAQAHPQQPQRTRPAVPKQTVEPASPAAGNAVPSRPVRPAAGATSAASTAAASAAAVKKRPTGAKKREKKRRGGGTASSLLKAMLYIIFVVAVSGLLSYVVITVGNDCFALVKATDEIELTIDEDMTTDKLAVLLEENNIISYPWAFELYTALRVQKEIDYVAGTYTVSPSMNYDRLRQTFQNLTNEREVLRITIPEGYTADQIINLMLENGIGTREGFVDVIQNYDFDFWFLDELEQSPDRKYRLEGYLYPDTYYFYSDSSEATVIYKLLVRFDELFTDKLRERCVILGWSVDYAVTLASLIQMEAKYEAEYGAIASVFVNRLRNPSYETVGKLDSDATIQYVLEQRETDSSLIDTSIDSPYNTYTNKGLPPGPISNPTQVALSYALWPSTTNYYYFVSKPDGWSLFASTYTEHLENIRQVAILAGG